MMRIQTFALLILSSLSLAAATPKPAKEWTLIIYMNGHNSLSEYTAKDINEMERLGSDANVNMVIQWASNEQKTTKRLLVQKDSDETQVSSPTLQDLPRVDMGNYLSLIDFVKWSVAEFPAKKYMIVVWSHGFGWHSALENKIRPLDLSNDDFTNHVITTPELGLALQQSARIIGHKVDLYGSDACSMASLEVATELKDDVHYFVGSEELEGSDGWVYDQILQQLQQNPGADARELGRIIADTYLAGNPDSDKSGGLTLSVSDLSQLDGFLAGISDLGKTISQMTEDELVDVREAADMSQRFWSSSDYRDGADFLKNLDIIMKDDDSSLKIDPQLMAYLHTSFEKIAVHSIHSPKYYSAYGLTLWIPQYMKLYKTHELEYQKLKFNQLTGWNTALRKIIRKSHFGLQ